MEITKALLQNILEIPDKIKNIIMDTISIIAITWYGQIAIFVIILLLLLFFSASLVGIVYIQQDKIGIVNKKFSAGKRLNPGDIVALNGEAGNYAEKPFPRLHFRFLSV